METTDLNEMRSRRPLKTLPLTPHHNSVDWICRPRATNGLTEETSISQGVTVWGAPELGHTIIFSGPSRARLTARQIYVDDILTPSLCYPCYQVAQVPSDINRIMPRPPTARFSQQCLQSDMTSYHGLNKTSNIFFANRECLGDALI
ncbi:hypothetical protein TNCV_3307331 [Trichonephila clavipes]|nr:hypothetical protein TNCV_3307331 [Trichonephila clavipes]